MPIKAEFLPLGELQGEFLEKVGKMCQEMLTTMRQELAQVDDIQRPVGFSREVRDLLGRINDGESLIKTIELSTDAVVNSGNISGQVRASIFMYFVMGWLAADLRMQESNKLSVQ